PPLLYWTTASANLAGLRDEWAARLPVAVMSLAFLVFFFLTIEREFSTRVALSATAILATCAGWIGYSFAAITDLPMSVAFGAAMLIALFDTRPHRGWIAGAMLGLAILAKGFVPVVLFIPVWLIARGKRSSTLAAAVLVAAPWYALVWIRNGSAFWNDFFWKQHVERFFSAQALQHGQPFWYYLPVLLAGLFPWTPLAALLARPKLYQEARARFLAVWTLFALVFFSAAKNKLPGYVLPLLPALAIVLAAALDKVKGQKWWMASCVALMTLLPTIAGGLPEALLSSVRKTHWSFGWGGLPFLLAAGAVWWLAWRGQSAAAMLTAALAVAAGVGYLKAAAIPALDQRVSVRSFWQANRAGASNACLGPTVPRAWEYGLNYYATRALPECSVANSDRFQISVQDRRLVMNTGTRLDPR
ncbi:MAG TPA: glycosyltransferase family 39 protein, partial [Bryobacteraceae bacterium]|nr:glycosyltransferase family 39 protein [Bryobacteraceae bacterium]